MTREQLLASLTTTPSANGVDFGDGRYADWNTIPRPGHVILEVGNADDGVQLELSRDELAALHQQLTLTLLRTAE